MVKKDIVISINVHEKPDYLFSQLKNIEDYVDLDYQVVLNCNDFMFFELSKIHLPDNVIVNPIVLNKIKFHGSILQGIVMNMDFSLSNYVFDYFVIMSSREFFYRKLENLEQIKNLKFLKENDRGVGMAKTRDYVSLNGLWRWDGLKKTKLFSYLENNNMYVSTSAHEGLCVDYESCQYVVNFLNSNEDISNDIFNNYNTHEEWAIQSLCDNFNGFYYIGNGVFDLKKSSLSAEKFTYKKER